MAVPPRPPSSAQVQYALRLLKQRGLAAPTAEEVATMNSVEVSGLIDGLLAKRGKPVFYGNGQFSHWQKGAGEKTAAANLKPVRQRTQFTCMASSMSMCLGALGLQDCDEDTVNRVMGAAPMRGAAWEQALATAQHYGVRATLTVPATLSQVKAWTDAGKPVMIGWNPEGREWSHASVIFDVQPCPVHGFMVHVADPNCPDPEQTVRIVPKNEFYAKWYEKFPAYLVRRPALMLEREVTPEGRQVIASMKTRSTVLGDAPLTSPVSEVPMSKQAKSPVPVVQKKDDKNVVRGEAPAHRNPVVQGLIERGTSGAGKHKNKQDYERGHARNPKHKGRGYDESMALPVEEACGAEYPVTDGGNPWDGGMSRMGMVRLAGYTNYWTYYATEEAPEGGFTDAQWSALTMATKKIIAAAAASGVNVAGPTGTGRPVITATHIALNGDASEHLDHETFYLVKTPDEDDKRFHMEVMSGYGNVKPGADVASGFCKTNQKPYDAVVVSILAAATRIGKGALKARSDSGRLKRVFATNAKPPQWTKALDAFIQENPLPLGDSWDVVKMSLDEFKVEAVESGAYLHAKTYDEVVSVVGKTRGGKSFKKQLPVDGKLVPGLIALLNRAKTASEVAGLLPSEAAQLRAAGHAPKTAAGLMTPHGWAPQTTAPGDVTRWESVDVESKNGGRTFDVVAYGRTTETNQEVRSVLAFGYRDADRARMEADAYRVKMRIRTAASSEYPSAVREIPNCVPTKTAADTLRPGDMAMWNGKRVMVLDTHGFPPRAVDVRWTESGVSGSKDEVANTKRNVPANQLTKLARHEAGTMTEPEKVKFFDLDKRAARYRDPYWMTAKFPGVDNKGRPFKRGDRVFYYPNSKVFLTGEDAVAAAEDFAQAAAYEEYNNRYASGSHTPYMSLIEADDALFYSVIKPVRSVAQMLESVEDIPASSVPFLRQLNKTQDVLRMARGETIKLRQMVERHQYWSPDDSE